MYELTKVRRVFSIPATSPSLIEFGYSSSYFLEIIVFFNENHFTSLFHLRNTFIVSFKQKFCNVLSSEKKFFFTHPSCIWPCATIMVNNSSIWNLNFALKRGVISSYQYGHNLGSRKYNKLIKCHYSNIKFKHSFECSTKPRATYI